MMLNKSAFSRFFTYTLSALLVLAFVLSAVPQSVQAATDERCEDTYTVKEGEKIWRIAKNHGMSAFKIAKANGLEFPYPVTAGMKLCIPYTSESASTVAFSASVDAGDNEVVLDGSGFKKQRTFFVRVRLNDSSKWYKLGHTVTDRDGDLDDSFDLPKDLRKAPVVTVCLKDSVSDALSCRQAFRR